MFVNTAFPHRIILESVMRVDGKYHRFQPHRAGANVSASIPRTHFFWRAIINDLIRFDPFVDAFAEAFLPWGRRSGSPSTENSACRQITYPVAGDCIVAEPSTNNK